MLEHVQTSLRPEKAEIMILIILAVLAYLLVAAIVGYFGRGRKFGAWGYFFASILLTPIIGLLLVLASDSAAVRRQHGLTTI
jgi:small-conductance mechanosensitive channel